MNTSRLKHIVGHDLLLFFGGRLDFFFGAGIVLKQCFELPPYAFCGFLVTFSHSVDEMFW